MSRKLFYFRLHHLIVAGIHEAPLLCSEQEECDKNPYNINKEEL